MSNNPLSSLISRRTFLKMGLVTGAALASSATVYGNAVEPYDIEITQHHIPIRKLSEKFEGYKIVQITDLHYGSWLEKDWLLNILDIVNAQDADIVAITGDFVTLGRIDPYADVLIETLSQLQASDGVVAVLGNHDHYRNTDQVRSMLQAANILELPNDSIIIKRDGDQLVIAGLDDVWENQHDIAKLVSTLPDDTPAVLLAHEPDIADEIVTTGRFALQLSGHSHGGQIRLPVIGAPFLPDHGKVYPMGKYQVSDMFLYTNRGVGMTLPLRINCRPEISVFTLTPA